MAIGPPASATLTFAGAAGGVTGSCYHLALGADAIMIDCGVFQGDRGSDELNRGPLPFAAEGVGAAVLTHGHLDHVGRLPLAGRRGFTGDVVGHGATLDIARIIMDDSAKLGIRAEAGPMYDDEDVARTMASARARPYGLATTLGPFTVKLFDAGHILGSSSVRVAWRDAGGERAILFSGDLGVAGAPLLRDPYTAWDPVVDQVDWVVTESTYGDRAHPDRGDVRRAFRDVIRRAIDDGGKVLVPAFSIGRTQELIYMLNGLVEAGELDGIPVVIDGPLGLSATRIYDRYRECWDAEAMAQLRRGDPPLEFDHLYKAQDGRASRRAVEIDGPAIIIAGSGMCNGGRIRHHLRAHLPDPKTDLLLVGYQANGTLGRALQAGERDVWIDGERIDVRARVTTISGLSAHADRDGLADWLRAVPRRAGAGVFVTHGELRTSEAYAQVLRDRDGVAARVPRLGDVVQLVPGA